MQVLLTMRQGRGVPACGPATSSLRGSGKSRAADRAHRGIAPVRDVRAVTQVLEVLLEPGLDGPDRPRPEVVGPHGLAPPPALSGGKHFAHDLLRGALGEVTAFLKALERLREYLRQRYGGRPTLLTAFRNLSRTNVFPIVIVLYKYTYIC